MAQRSHTCSICGMTGPWTGEWSWFGSYRDIDDGIPVFEFCSANCQETFDERREEAEAELDNARARAKEMGLI